MTCLAKGGPAEQGGAVRIGDAVVYVDSLDVRELMNNVRRSSRCCGDTWLSIRALENVGADLAVPFSLAVQPDTSKYDVSRGVSTVLANALLGEPGTKSATPS